MNRSILRALALGSLTFFYGSSGLLIAKNASSLGTSQNHAIIKKLSPPIYPPLARQTRVAGEVVIDVEVNSDGTVASASVVRGHPLLGMAALDSAKHSIFVCSDCGASTQNYVVTYGFKLDDIGGCATGAPSPKSDSQPELPYPRVSQIENHVTITDRYVSTCDLGPDPISKVRSIKCLFLWRCATPRRVIGLE